jgi:hypothetical protein
MTAPKPRRVRKHARTCQAIAVAVVRDCRRQDGSLPRHYNAREKIEGWHRSAAAAGDELVVAAIDFLGLQAAMTAYRRPPLMDQIGDVERAKLLRGVARLNR